MAAAVRTCEAGAQVSSASQNCGDCRSRRTNKSILRPNFRPGVKWMCAEENFLDHFHGFRVRHLRAAVLVGTGGADSGWLCELVVRLSQRSVLRSIWRLEILTSKVHSTFPPTAPPPSQFAVAQPALTHPDMAAPNPRAAPAFA